MFYPSWYAFTKNDEHVIFKKFRKWNVSDRLSELTQIYMSNIFSKRHGEIITLMLSPLKRLSLSIKSMLENFLANLQSREESNSSVFEELQEHGF